MDTVDKIAILADAAKYDASCSTSGSARANTKGGIGNAAVGGICHAWSADGRCVALLKVLLSNVCAFDCAYCINRRSSDIPRAGFEPEELIRLVLDFYKRNYIEGALLSSGVIGCPDTTMERLVAVARTLRTRERFNGYLHLKAIPGACDQLVMEAARWADRVSVNIELPSAASLATVAPDKTPASIFGPMRVLASASGFEPRRLNRIERRAEPEALCALPAGSRDMVAAEPDADYCTAIVTTGSGSSVNPSPCITPIPPAPGDRLSVMDARKNRSRNPGAAILPAGQTTQMVIGASPESDRDILVLAENLYLAYDVRRVYYSAYVPTSPDPRVPALAGPPLLREHRLYQADWLFRFYGFSASEILDPLLPDLDPELDPKCTWALRNLHLFPIDVNAAEYRDLLRIPGIGPRSATRIVRARREAPLRIETLGRLGIVMKRARWFLCCSGTPAFTTPARGSSPHCPSIDNPGALRNILIDGAPAKLAPLQREFAF
ncbi:MAG: putative DNA modification/repair radical SAM protein [Spirochaetales bacterium]|nr:MAG: putative DNA modification/repair radical SAM protein [Spirochaetales bacterium]